MPQAAAVPAAPAAPAPAAPPTPVASGGDRAAAVQAPAKEAEKPAERVRVRGYERARQLKAKLAEEETGGDDAPATRPEPKTPAKAEPKSKADPKPGPAKAEPREREREPAERPEPKPEPAKADADKPAAVDHAAARHERLQKAAERERREQAERKQRDRGRQQQTSLEREVETMRKRLAELEPLGNVFTSEEALLEEAERRNLSPEKLAQWMRTKLSDPAAVAQRQAKTEADKLREEMRAMQQRIEQAEEQRRQERAQYEAQQEGMRRALSFVGMAKGGTETHPLTAQLQGRFGDEGLLQFVNTVIAPHLPEQYALEELHDHLEEFLERVQVAQATGTPANGASRDPKNAADQAPITLSNAVTQERGSVTEAVPLARMPRRERHAYLRDKYRES